MLAIQIMILGIFLLVIPTVVGSLFRNVDRRIRNLPFMWISGQMLLWAGFQVITVPLILSRTAFTQVVWLFLGYTVVVLLLSLLCHVMSKRKGRYVLHPVEEKPKRTRTYYVLWALFWGILLFQLIQAFHLTYADGDDAFYVAVSSITESSNAMYRVSAYTGLATELEIRYGLAPFPIWIAFLARVSGLPAVSVAQVFVPPVMIAMAYGVYYLLGKRLLAKNQERLPLFMFFVELLILFGNYSIYTSERFLLERSRQGKATLSAIVIPMLIFQLLVLMDKMQEKQKLTFAYWMSLLCTLTAACLCSSLGTVLVSLLVGCTGVCAAFSYRRWKFLLPLAGCCIPCVIVAMLYMMY